jgi:hypothetical protein
MVQMRLTVCDPREIEADSATDMHDGRRFLVGSRAKS